ncbi:PAS domain-containing hybrid sensor histidine kinase/response regulator [Echinicola strongylocentroti]|uniref:PAS domain-containing hybrid sensor histidine kinase/response regulator n=1 Tax=Echinicola strongylocentroti TaxID=1795355 RepID=UPI001FE47EDB|nr:PAS domain S-box protein [Echinicola strongylocentroti]
MQITQGEWAFIASSHGKNLNVVASINANAEKLAAGRTDFIKAIQASSSAGKTNAHLNTNGKEPLRAIISPLSLDDKKVSRALIIVNPPIKAVQNKELEQINLIAEEISDSYFKNPKSSSLSNNQFEFFFHQSMGLMCTHDPLGKILLVNNASANSLGYKKEELEEKSLYDLIPKERHVYLNEYLKSILKSGHSQGTMQVLHKDGSIRYWLFTNVLQKDENGAPFILGNALDITERHKLEHEYNRLKEMLEQTNSVARVGGWDLDLVKGEIYWSDVTREIHEVPDDFVPDTERAIGFFKEGKHRKAIQKAFDNAVSNGQPYDLELILITVTGKEVWTRAIGKPEFKNGKCIRVYGTFQDISAQKLAEMEIIKSKKLLEDVQNASSEVSIISTNTEGIITLFNNGAEKMLGYSAAEMIGQQTPAIIHEPKEIQERSKELSERYGQEITGFKVFVFKSELEGAEEREWTYIRKDGSKLFVSLAVTTMRNGNGEITGYLGMATDITERKEAENALLIEQARLNAFVTHAPAAVAMFDTDIKYIAYSNRWIEEYQLQNQEIRGKSHYEVFGNISEGWKDIHHRCLQGEVISNEEDRWRPEGWDHDQFLRWEVRPWHHYDGSIGGIMMLTQDITESCLQRDELKKAKILAEQASKAKSEFLANMSHEIRTPLNGVIGFTDLVLKTDLSDTQEQYLSIVNQSGNALLNIINDILDFSKIEAGKLELDIDKCDLYELTEQASDIITYEVHKKGLEMLLNIHPDVPRFIWMDSVRLKQILVNLLGNASKFTETGEIELQLHPLSQLNEENEITLRFSVRDTGIGIKEEKQSKIFEAFSQEDISTTKKYGGTGLGLTISNSLLQMMDSGLKLKSKVGEGSTFFFDLTVKSEQEEPDIIEEDIDIQRVLIVDDNDNNRMILERMMSLRGIESVQAKNGFEALQKLVEEGKFDVVLMDYHMPYMNGIETIRKIREIVEHQPIIFLHSSSDDDRILKACKELGVRKKLVKPIKLQEMYNALLTINKKQDHQKTAKTNISKNHFPEGTTVLVVEDNSINMLLAKTVIHNLSPTTKILEATNGLEALTVMKTEIPEVIFMDVQMPEMNGYEATREIRKIYNKHDILIIALTAGNVKGEREKCLQAGMNDFIAKPFVEADVVNLLKKWESDKENDASSANKTVIQSSSFQQFDLEKFQAVLGFPDLESEMFQVILKSGLKELEKSSVQLEDILHSKGEGLSIAAHKLYSTASAMYLTRLSQLSSKMETRRNFDFSDPSLENEIKMILEEVNNAKVLIEGYTKN